jgi:hypothetical protein
VPSVREPKARGVNLGNLKIEAASDKAIAAAETGADRTAANALPTIAEIRRLGATSLRAVRPSTLKAFRPLMAVVERDKSGFDLRSIKELSSNGGTVSASLAQPEDDHPDSRSRSDA